MAYTSIAYSHVEDDFLRDVVFRRTDMLLGDVHTMLSIKTAYYTPSCGWSAAIALLCVIDGLASHVYPTKGLTPERQARFKRLIKDKLHWSKSREWTDKGQAASLLYEGFRNPLVNRLADTVISKWGLIPTDHADFDVLAERARWDDSWPIMGAAVLSGERRVYLSAAGLWWATRNMVQGLANNPVLLAQAVASRQRD